MPEKLTPEQEARKADVLIRKAGGDDLYSWALFFRGRMQYNGMDKREAEWRRDRYVKEGAL